MDERTINSCKNAVNLREKKFMQLIAALTEHHSRSLEKCFKINGWTLFQVNAVESQFDHLLIIFNLMICSTFYELLKTYCFYGSNVIGLRPKSSLFE